MRLVVLSVTFQVPLPRHVLDQAGGLLPGMRLRTMDAIHLASALSVGSELTALLTYDARQAVAAHDLGIGVVAPGQDS